MNDELFSLLQERDSVQKLPFEGLIGAIDEYAGKLESCLLQLEALRFKHQRLHRHSVSTESVSDGSAAQSPAFSSAAADLQQKLLQLKEERAELYKQQGLHASQVLTLNEQLRAKDSQLAQLHTKLAEAEVRLKAEQAAAAEAKRRFKEKEMEARAVGDELVALHLEMLRLEGCSHGNKTDASAQPELANDSSHANKSDASAQPEPASPGPVACFTLPPLSIACEKELIAPHQYPITAVASVPQRRLLLTGSEDQKIVLYDLTRISTRAVLKWSSINGAIVALAASESGMIASCTAYDQEVALWSTESGRVVGTLPYKPAGTGQVCLTFDACSSGRLWMAQGTTVRLWDTSRLMLLRTWQQPLSGEIMEIVSDGSRPDRAWIFGADGSWGLLNGISGKVDRCGQLPGAPRLISCGRGDGCSATASFVVLLGDGRLIGYRYGSFEGYFEVAASACGSANNADDDDIIDCIAIHPSKADLIAVSSRTRGHSHVEIIRLSPDNWAPQRAAIAFSDAADNCGGGGRVVLQWGPEEADPISREPLWRLAAIASESRVMKLYSIK